MADLETKRRHIIKAVSYRFVGASVGAFIAYLLTGRLSVAAAFGLLDIFIKIGAYYAHERLWERINFGRVKAQDYDI